MTGCPGPRMRRFSHFQVSENMKLKKLITSTIKRRKEIKTFQIARRAGAMLLQGSDPKGYRERERGKGKKSRRDEYTTDPAL